MNHPRNQMMATDLGKRFSRWMAIASLIVLLVSVFGFTALLSPPPAFASILQTADQEAVIVQSRRTLRDQHRQSWQVIAFKRMQPGILEQPLYLRLVAFPSSVAIDHPQPILLSNVQGQVWTAADRSDQIAASAQASVGQYQLQAILSELSEQALRLEVATVEGEAIVLRIPPALIQEWQTVAQTGVSPLMCDRFPLEARQNPAFPEWTGCRME